MRTVWWTILPVTAVLAGCAGTGVSRPAGGATAAPPAAEQRCDSTGAQWAVGKTNTVKHVEEARRHAGALMARVLRPGQPATMDYNFERLNLQVDASGRIIAATCG